MLTYEVEQANFDSWARTALLFEEQPDNEYWIPYKNFMHGIFQRAAMELVSSYLRAGQSMPDLLNLRTGSLRKLRADSASHHGDVWQWRVVRGCGLQESLFS